eukprot:SAG11_NODE_363_length_10162_cov_28.285004_13_plen_113_part_00
MRRDGQRSDSVPKVGLSSHCSSPESADEEANSCIATVASPPHIATAWTGSDAMLEHPTVTRRKKCALISRIFPKGSASFTAATAAAEADAGPAGCRFAAIAANGLAPYASTS